MRYRTEFCFAAPSSRAYVVVIARLASGRERLGDASRFRPNLLLRALSEPDLDLLKPHLQRVRLEREQVLVRPNEIVREAYFPEGGIASIVSLRPDSGRTEVGIFGREGMSSPNLLIGVDRTPHETFIQVDSSTALRVEADALRDATARSSSLATLLLAYVQVTFVQLAACAVGNAHHLLEGRLAR